MSRDTSVMAVKSAIGGGERFHGMVDAIPCPPLCRTVHHGSALESCAVCYEKGTENRCCYGRNLL